MEEIEKKLEEIIQEQLKLCKKDKTVPSSELLDTIKLLIRIKYS